MTAPSTKQINLAQRLFTKHAEITARHDPLYQGPKDWQADMVWLGLDPEDRADVSRYLDIYMAGNRAARITMHR